MGVVDIAVAVEGWGGVEVRASGGWVVGHSAHLLPPSAFPPPTPSLLLRRLSSLVMGMG